jgi:hypothetical protein
MVFEKRHRVSSAFGFCFRIKLIQNFTSGNGKLYPLAVFVALPMDRQLADWKFSIERIWSAAAPDYHEAARLAAEIAAVSEQAMLRQAATQALPILRSAWAEDADHATLDAARRRLGVVREVLHTLTTPRFGKRQIAATSLTPEQCYRQLLELPLGRRLSNAEIHRAYKRVAKRAHPDGGGSAREFLELSAARDALMKER